MTVICVLSSCQVGIVGAFVMKLKWPVLVHLL